MSTLSGHRHSLGKTDGESDYCLNGHKEAQKPYTE